MIKRKNVLIMALCICAFTALYLFQVKKERQQSVTQYAPDPRPGDIYKMQQETPEDGVMVFYLKVNKIDDEGIHFFRSRLSAGAEYDVLLGQFDSDKKWLCSKNDLLDIAAGKWMNSRKDKTQILEIERK